MTPLNPADVSLDKWPRLIVVGEPVPGELAAEIIIRTTNWWYMGANDKVWLRAIGEIVGAPFDDYGSLPSDEAEKINKRFRVLDLNYMVNNWIVSSWIGGPHGWIDWDGVVGCSTWNIGKYPEAEEVHKDWGKIAQAWPTLNLKAQLLLEEGEGRAVVEWHVENGTVECVVPEGDLTPVINLSTATILNRLRSVSGERGCSGETLRYAIKVTEEAVAALPPVSDD